MSDPYSLPPTGDLIGDSSWRFVRPDDQLPEPGRICRQRPIRGGCRYCVAHCDVCDKVDRRVAMFTIISGKSKNCGCINGRDGKGDRDLTGIVFGMLMVLKFSHVNPNDRKKYWLCQCECGTVRTFSGYSLMAGTSESCGCKRIDVITKHGHRPRIGKSPEYQSWTAMIGRCYNENNCSYDRYGDIGVIVHEEWRESFAAFFAYVGKRPSHKHSIGRIRHEGNYEPGNVAWQTPKEQSMDKSNVDMVTFNGETHPRFVWAERLGMSSQSLKHRIEKWGKDKALTTPKKQYRETDAKHLFQGEMLTIREISDKTGTSHHLIRLRLRRGATIDEAADPAKKR